MSNERPIESLEDLFRDAVQHSKPVMRNASPEAKKHVKVSEKYTLPEFWIKGHTVALIHEETKTLLGNFQEFRHKTEKAARKLVRIEEPAAVTQTEWVSGDAWLGTRKQELTVQSWTSRRRILLPDLLLECLAVHAELIEVEVFLQWGGIGRVELLDHTTFHSPDACTALTLPAGTNVLEVMNLASKIELRKELGA